jgi:beta-lactamase class A
MKPAGRWGRIAPALAILLAIAALSWLIPLGRAGFSGIVGAPASPPSPGLSPATGSAAPAPGTGTASSTGVPDRTSPAGTPSVGVEGWIARTTPVRAAPSLNAVIDFILDEDVPVTVVVDQIVGTGWLLVRPQAMADRTGYVPVSAVTYRPPAAGTVSTASMSALSPDLADYLSGWGTQVGVTVMDLRTDTTYSYNGDHPFVTASAVKVALMFALLRQLEAEDESPTDEQLQLLTAMIEWSDNDAAEAIDEMIGDRGGLEAFAEELGLAGFRPGSTYEEGWGWGTLTPDAMVRMLALFQRGEILSRPADYLLARHLLSSVESDQRTGVGSTAPDGAFVMMKNGWTPGPDDLWVFNSSGIVEVDGHAYIVAAFTAHDDSLEQGEEIVVHVCAAIAAQLG